MGRRLAVFVLVGACGPSQQQAPTATSEDAEESSSSDLPPAPCAFEPIAEEPHEAHPACNGRLEPQCEAVDDCHAVYGRSIITCTDAAVECAPEPIFLGCAPTVVCEQDSNFMCSQDMRSIFATGADCIPPTDWLACAPSEGAERVAELALSCLR